MGRNICKFTLCAAFSAVLAACGGSEIDVGTEVDGEPTDSVDPGAGSGADGDSNNDNDSELTGIARIAGLWGSTEPGIARFMAISEAGAYSSYVYSAEDQNGIASCFFIFDDIAEIQPLSDNTFQYISVDEGIPVEYDLSASVNDAGLLWETEFESLTLPLANWDIADIREMACDEELFSEVDSINDVVGLWDATEVIDGLTNEVYWELSAAGRYSTYDYQGDGYDQGGNCYVIKENIARVQFLSDNTFRYEPLPASEGLFFSLTIEKQEGGNGLRWEMFGDAQLLAQSSQRAADFRMMECDG